MPPPAEPKPKPPSAFARLKRALLAPIFGKPPNPPASVDVVARSRELRPATRSCQVARLLRSNATNGAPYMYHWYRIDLTRLRMTNVCMMNQK